VLIPRGGYSSETGLALGGQVVLPIRFPGASNTDSETRLYLLRTLKGQTEGEFSTSVFPGEGTYELRGKLRYTDLYERYYGIGGDTPEENEELYRPRTFLAYVEALRQVVPRLRAGLRLEFEHLTLIRYEEGGLLDQEAILATSDESVLGGGVVVEVDTRNQRYSPSRGLYYQGFAMIFDDALGGEQDFNTYNLDLRNYFPIGGGHVLATQAFLYSARGDAPVWRYAALGGRAHTRAYQRARYLDRVLLSIQAEYRSPIYKRAGFVVFAGWAEVQPHLGDMRLDSLKPTLGLGLRYLTSVSTGFKTGIDAAFGEQSYRIKLTIDEAF
jgi:hypothetical protein